MDWPRTARWADTMVVAVLAVSGQIAVWTAASGPLADDRAVHAVLLALATLPLAVRRAHPLPVLLLVVGAGWLQFRLGGQTFQPWFALLMALYGVAAHAGLRPASAGAAVTALAVLPTDVGRLAAGEPVDDVLPAWAFLAAVWGLGRWVRSRRRHTEDLADRVAAAERDRAAHAAAAVEEERARIARELHDLVAHSMGIIVIQAQAGQRSLDTHPDLARGAMAAIETAGRQGLAELRRLLGLLTGAPDGTVTPQPSLRRIGELADRVREAGLAVELTVDGEPGALPAGVDLAAYRIVQEALTNVLKHADARTAHVLVRCAHGAVELEVRDDGRGTSAPGWGHGLVGMRERAALYGGSLESGPLPDGGYRVRARLAVDRAPV